MGIGRHGIAAQQLLNDDGAQRIDAGPATGDVLQGGHLQNRNPFLLDNIDDAAALAAAERRDGQQHLAHLEAADQLGEPLGGMDSDSI